MAALRAGVSFWSLIACAFAAPAAAATMAASPATPSAAGTSSTDRLPAELATELRRRCAKCHTGKEPEGGVDLNLLLGRSAKGRPAKSGGARREAAKTGPVVNVGVQGRDAAGALSAHFKTWRRVATALADGDMPPDDAPQPTDAMRARLVSEIRGTLDRIAAAQERDPGPVVMRRLTSAELSYTIEDLTGLRLDLGRDFVSDAVGGEGFTNVGGAQFMQDSTLERYLDVAKRVAAHAVIGAGPLGFFRDPGASGLELSAVERIQAIYRKHGFRHAAGEGGEPFGLDRYPKAFLAAWRYRHRAALGKPDASMAQLATAEGIAPRFLEHVLSVFEARSPSFPLSEIVARWRALPPPREGREPPGLKAACADVWNVLGDWQTRLAANVGNQEQPVIFAEAPLAVAPRHAFLARLVKPAEKQQIEVVLATTLVNAPAATVGAAPLVVWRDPQIRFRVPGKGKTRVPAPFRPLAEAMAPAHVARMRQGQASGGLTIGPRDFVTSAGELPFDIEFPVGTTSAELRVEAVLAPPRLGTSVVRVGIRRSTEEVKDGEEVWTFLGAPGSPTVTAWTASVRDLARQMPQISHREPVPSDRDPIADAFDNSYNNDERNYFHTRLKYHRDDRFLVEHFLDDAERQRLDQAWTDLFASFDYHDSFLAFLAKKHGLALGERGVADLDRAEAARLPEPARTHVTRLVDHQAAVRAAVAAAEPGHVQDVLAFAARAWRRPLSPDEQTSLLAYYKGWRAKADHPAALRLLIARVLVAPAFLYRAEAAGARAAGAPLDDHELASRLSYFLWASPPDEALREAASAGALRAPAGLVAQARRMLVDPRSRRMATEFFGQWFGFYQFDRYTGVDAQRFPEFNDSLRAALYAESIEFFTHLVRADRPLDEILAADYTFLNQQLARHYGLPDAGLGKELVLVRALPSGVRGGLLGLGSILIVTSAPLRTSPVKRGDWILRRILGTPVPPPPANAGSIAADDVGSDRKTVRDRLEAHRQNPACVNCHARIDPLGFALERFDPLGRWRDRYRDGERIDDAGTLLGGAHVAGPGGLRAYLRDQAPSFHRTLAAKLVAYALGRSPQLSDQRLIDGIVDKLAGGGRFSDLVELVVASPAFRFHRGDGRIATLAGSAARPAASLASDRVGGSP